MGDPMQMYNKNQNLLGSAMFSNDPGDYVQYTPVGMAAGKYCVSFWNIKYPDTNPVKMTAKIQTAYETIENIELKPNVTGKDRSGRWEKIGTYFFSGSGDEYVRFTVTGRHARVADVKWVPESTNAGRKEVIIGTGDAEFRMCGHWGLSFFGDSKGFCGYHVQANIINPGQETTPCSHFEYELMIVKEGDCVCFCDHTQYRLQSNSVVFIPSGADHSLLNQGVKKCSIINIFMHSIFYDKVIKLIGCVTLDPKPDPTVLKNELAAALIYKLDYICDIRNHIPIGHKAIIAEGVINELLLYLFTNFIENREHIPSWLNSARMQMARNNNFVSGIQQFVALSGRSQEHLTRCMKKYYHETPTAFINALRIHKAKELLLQTNLSITDIIYEVGFTSASHFYKLFLEYYHIPPTRFRSNQ